MKKTAVILALLVMGITQAQVQEQKAVVPQISVTGEGKSKWFQIRQ